MTSMTVICGCGKVGTVPVPYQPFKLFEFVMEHHQGEETVPGAVTLVCACGATRFTGPTAERDKDPFTAGAEMVLWFDIHRNCKEVLA